MTICKSYDESTAADFRKLFVERFPDGDASILGIFLSDPARREHPSCGSIAFDYNGSVKAILGLLPRIVFYGQHPMRTLNGVAIAVRKDADRNFFPGFIRDAITSDGADMFFVNTAIPPSRKRVMSTLDVFDGPSSCAEIRERTLRGAGLAARAVKKLLAKLGIARTPIALPVTDEVVVSRDGLVLSRENKIADQDFNSFWSAYLKGNDGLVSSRTAEELRWVFGSGLESGEIVLLTARKNGALQGYAFCRCTDETATCWRVVDLIALENDAKILESLIEGASQFLRTCTPALYLQITGYPTWVQPLLKRLFPKSSSFGFNKCIWTCLNDNAKALCGDWVNSKGGWYGCPYDGDMCLM